eukprot:TRINITY_DN286_c0_g1_i7.p1 TRINITY_DN286_c0_g1~~TRINITY_DN286_c0_g1_i7.p1  ORF type:complete len:393 (+),score=48.61 TRINITY_DN286_c0_g1_i7:73-1251(+)
MFTSRLMAKVGALRSYSTRRDFALRHLSPGIGRLCEEEFVSAQGSYVTTSDGKKLLDFTMGIGVTNVGHCHPRVVKAIQEQAARITHGQVNIAFHKPMLDLLEKLLPIMPHPDLDTFFFWNSGAEAVEAAIKLARHATQKQNIVVFNGGYHGRTFGTMSLTTSKTIYRAAYGPLLPGVFVAPFPKFFQERLRYGSRVSEGEIVSRCLEEIEMMLKEQTAPGETCAFLVEPVLGEGGYIPTPPSFMKGLREITKKNNILLIVDEVQTGFGRTGKWFGVEHSGVVPDILVFAKGSLFSQFFFHFTRVVSGDRLKFRSYLFLFFSGFIREVPAPQKKCGGKILIFSSRSCFRGSSLRNCFYARIDVVPTCGINGRDICWKCCKLCCSNSHDRHHE